MSKPGIVNYVEENWGINECMFYESLFYSAQVATLTSAFTGQFWLSAGLAGVTTAIQGTASMAGCFANLPEPPGGEPGEERQRCGDCWEVDGPANLYWISGQGEDQFLGVATKITSITDMGPGAVQGSTVYRLLAIDLEGEVLEAPTQLGYNGSGYAYLVPVGDGVCLDDGCGGGDETHEPGEPIAPPETIPDVEGCTWTRTAIDARIDDRGMWQTYWKLESNDPANCGGPFYYWTGDDGPIWVTPGPGTPDPDNPDEDPVPPTPPPPGWQPDPQDCPDPCPDPKPDVVLPQTMYQLSGVCESVPEGQPQPVQTWSIDQAEGIVGLSRRIDTLALMLQKHLELKTPACVERDQQDLRGSWVTTRWKSEETMVHSGTRLRKLFRYRSESTRNLPELSAYWEGFTWRSGDVCVRHQGAWWGNPQVWAETEEEGKRVIRHAAAEAGLDPDQVGRWAISSSRSPRIGMSGTMKILKLDGFPWVASRSGSDWPNTLALNGDP